MYATPEAHFVGPFDYEGKIIGKNRIEWTAYYTTSLSSYFAENWHGIDIVNDRIHPQEYGSVRQIVKWRTDFSGKRII